MTPAVNTRQHPRYEIRISAEVATMEQSFTCTTRDLSAGGVGLSCDRGLDVGSPVRVTLFVVVDDIEDLGTEALVLEATIIWCKQMDPEKFDVGLQFMPMNEKKTAYLKRFLMAVSPAKK